MSDFVGRVISNKMQKSVLVAIERWAVIPKYKRKIKRTTKLMAHDEADTCKVGDVVRIHMCRPLSRHKSFTVTDVLRREKIFDESTAARLAAKQTSTAQRSTFASSAVT